MRKETWMSDIGREVSYQWYISPIRISIALLAAFALTMVLVFPNDTGNLIYTAFIFQPEFLWLRITFVIVMLLAISMNIPHLGRAVARKPSFLVSSESLIVKGLTEKIVSISEIARLENGTPGTLYVVLKSGRKVGIPTMFYKDASQMKSVLRGLANPATVSQTSA
jgi:hypothetical protein